MLQIVEKTDRSCRTLRHDEQVFHKALHHVMRGGETEFHVKNPQGEDYDLVYVVNNDTFPKPAYAQARPIVPPYLMYDETLCDRIYLGIFGRHESVIFETADEYTITLAKVLLARTELVIYFGDERVYWFIEPCDRLIVRSDLPDKKEVNAFLCSEETCFGFMRGIMDQMSSQFLFHNVFFYQWMTDKPLDQIENVEITIGNNSGIAGLLSYMTKISEAFKERGYKIFLQEDSSRYKDEMLSKYFNIRIGDDSVTEENTMFIPNMSPLCITHFLAMFPANLTSDILSDSFKAELEEYYDAILAGHKYIGVLMRGTDYISTKLSGTRQHATVDDMVPMMREWMDEYGYDGIFLATEDQDILDRMMEEFPGQVRAIAQERHRVSDFKDGQTISQLELEERSGQEYFDALEDTTVNYFYALYLLSKCDGFMVSGQCNGWDTVLSLNNGKFSRTYKFQVGI